MQIVTTFPPNISTIRQYLTPPPDAVFAFGDTIYNPTGKEVPRDVLIHELVHMRQMQEWLPDVWWQMYLMDSEFRKQIEVEAFSAQYFWVKERVPNRVAKLCLNDLADNLCAPWYNLKISHSQAETLIRKFKK